MPHLPQQQTLTTTSTKTQRPTAIKMNATQLLQEAHQKTTKETNSNQNNGNYNYYLMTTKSKTKHQMPTTIKQTQHSTAMFKTLNNNIEKARKVTLSLFSYGVIRNVIVILRCSFAFCSLVFVLSVV